ncbi:IS21-like element helper ATPase IstB [Thermovenabulum gondwanense]|uniref:Chromosomal replication initiator protein DnaA n=1 Tax=Thermovenabulum gondwanense TaxID=520767 RepID=A0A162MTZ9_9FIRM|nr:IS21-like element helper ATPase IstB [Thermovenabulum gondwanense]KYO67333.1 Chromosomal replication initiator protein DnaA [Thermovenabulum gondwanense]
MLRDEIADCCKALKLSQNFAENFDKIEAKSHGEYLLKLLKLEIEHRETRKRERLLKKAGFYTIKTFADYIFDEIKLPTGLTQKDLKECKFIEEKRNLILYGNVGTGKTHLATAIGVEACKKGLNVKFFRTAALVNRLGEARKRGELSGLLKQFSKLDLLICDEWGYVPLEREGAQLLFQVISDCYERRSVVITTNLEFSRWASIFYDEQMTTAMIDRLIHHSYLLIFDGQSYRMRQSLMRQLS